MYIVEVRGSIGSTPFFLGSVPGGWGRLPYMALAKKFETMADANMAIAQYDSRYWRFHIVCVGNLRHHLELVRSRNEI
jgi:hypothetical protein